MNRHDVLLVSQISKRQFRSGVTGACSQPGSPASICCPNSRILRVYSKLQSLHVCSFTESSQSQSASPASCKKQLLIHRLVRHAGPFPASLRLLATPPKAALFSCHHHLPPGKGNRPVPVRGHHSLRRRHGTLCPDFLVLVSNSPVLH